MSQPGVIIPVVSLNSTNLRFAVQNLGTVSRAQSIILTNSSTTALNLASIAASGDFSVTNFCGSGLIAGGSPLVDCETSLRRSGDVPRGWKAEAGQILVLVARNAKDLPR